MSREFRCIFTPFSILPDSGAQEEKYPPYLGPDNSTWHGGGGEQRSRGMDPQQAFYEETYPQFEEGYYEEPFVEPIKHSHGHNYGPPDHRLPWISPGEGYASGQGSEPLSFFPSQCI